MEEEKLIKRIMAEVRKEERQKAKKKRGLTDKIFIWVFLLGFQGFFFSEALMWKTNDTTGLAYFLPALAGVVTIVLTAIVEKNKRENINKNRRDDVDE